MLFVLDNSAFSELEGQMDSGFRLFNKFAVFLYCQLQNILPDQTLGSISVWDNYLCLDLDRTDLPFKTASGFVLNVDYHNLVIASKLPRPGKLIDQSSAFCKFFCKILLKHELVNSNLIRGLSSFDFAVMVEGSERHYVSAVEKRTTYFVNSGWLSPSDKVKCVSQYRSLATKLRADSVVKDDNWVQYLASHYEMQRRPDLLHLFRYACLCLPPFVGKVDHFEVPVPTLSSDKEMFRSCVTSLQQSYLSVPHVSSLYRDQRSIGRAFRLLGRGQDLLIDKKFSIWNFLNGSGPRRTALRGKLEAAYKRSVLQAEKVVVESGGTTLSLSRSTSNASTPSPGPSLGRLSVSVARCSEDDSSKSVAATKPKSSKSQKN